MKCFVRQQKIPNAQRRSDYIAREGRFADKGKENVLLFVDAFQHWDELAAFEKAQPRFTNEARELIIALPNEMSSLYLPRLENDCKQLAESLLTESTPYAFAVHWNETKTNLHMHLLFSERSYTAVYDPAACKRYRQDIWAKEDGSRALKKEDRHHIMHHKGDIQLDKKGMQICLSPCSTAFTQKDKRYKSKAWLQDIKDRTKNELKLLGYDVSLYDPKSDFLAEKHRGKGITPFTDRIDKQNTAIRDFNQNIGGLKQSYKVSPETLQNFKKEAARSFRQGVFQPIFSRIELFIEKAKNFVVGEFKELSKAIQTLEDMKREGFIQPATSLAGANARYVNVPSYPREHAGNHSERSTKPESITRGTSRATRTEPRQEFDPVEKLTARYERNKRLLAKLQQDILKRRNNPNDPDIKKLLGRTNEFYNELRKQAERANKKLEQNNCRSRQSHEDYER